MNVQHELNLREIRYRYDREDKTCRLQLASQQEIIAEKKKLSLHIAKLVVVLLLCALFFFYIITLCDTEHHYTALAFMVSIFVGVCWFAYQERLSSRRTWSFNVQLYYNVWLYDKAQGCFDTQFYFKVQSSISSGKCIRMHAIYRDNWQEYPRRRKQSIPFRKQEISQHRLYKSDAFHFTRSQLHDEIRLWINRKKLISTSRTRLDMNMLLFCQ